MYIQKISSTFIIILSKYLRKVKVFPEKIETNFLYNCKMKLLTQQIRETPMKAQEMDTNLDGKLFMIHLLFLTNF